MTNEKKQDIENLMGGIPLKDAIEAGLIDPSFDESHEDYDGREGDE